MKGSSASNEAILQTIFRVLLFSKEVFEPMKFTKLLRRQMLFEQNGAL